MKKITRYLIFLIVFIFFTAMLTACSNGNVEIREKSEEDKAFDEVLDIIYELEAYARAYSRDQYKKVMLGFLRVDRYDDFFWNTLAGKYDTKFDSYLSDNTANMERLASLRKIDLIKTPILHEQTDLIHMFGTMSMILTKNGDLGGWAGDIATLAEDLKNDSGTVDELLAISNEKYFNVYGGFDAPDLIADCDAIIFMNKWSVNMMLADVMRSYYYDTVKQTKDRISLYMQSDDISNELSLNEMRTYIYNRVTSNLSIIAFWKNDKFDYKLYDNQVKAACYSYADYLYNNK